MKKAGSENERIGRAVVQCEAQGIGKGRKTD
jgi:hypothetical protein